MMINPPSPNEIREKHSKLSTCPIVDRKSQNTTKSTTAANNNETMHTKMKEFWQRSTKSFRTNTTSSQHEEDNNERMKKLRKVGVAVAGGTLIAVGIPLVPLPGPGDVMIVGGVALLATEFPAAQKLIDDARNTVSDFVQDDDKVQEDTPTNDQSTNNHTAASTTSPSPQESIRTGAKWVGKQILPVLDHFATVSPSSQPDTTTTATLQNLSDNQEEEEVDSPLAKKFPLPSPNVTPLTSPQNCHNMRQTNSSQRIHWM